jgi:hypothetical protein
MINRQARNKERKSSHGIQYSSAKLTLMLDSSSPPGTAIKHSLSWLSCGQTRKSVESSDQKIAHYQ